MKVVEEDRNHLKVVLLDCNNCADYGAIEYPWSEEIRNRILAGFPYNRSHWVHARVRTWKDGFNIGSNYYHYVLSMPPIYNKPKLILGNEPMIACYDGGLYNYEITSTNTPGPIESTKLDPDGYMPGLHSGQLKVRLSNEETFVYNVPKVWLGPPMFSSSVDTIFYEVNSREPIEISYSVGGETLGKTFEHFSGSDEYNLRLVGHTYTITPTLNPNIEGEIIFRASASNQCGRKEQYHKIKLNIVPPKNQVKIEGPEGYTNDYYAGTIMHRFKVKGIDTYREIFPNAKIEWNSNSGAYPPIELFANGDEVIFFPDNPYPAIVSAKITNEEGDTTPYVTLQKGLDFAQYPYVELVGRPTYGDTIYLEDAQPIKVRLRGFDSFDLTQNEIRAGAAAIWHPRESDNSFGYITDERLEKDSIWGYRHTAIFHPTKEMKNAYIGITLKAGGIGNQWDGVSNTFDIALRNQPIIRVTIYRNFYPYNDIYYMDFASEYELQYYDFTRLLTEIGAPAGKYIEEWMFKNGTTRRDERYFIGYDYSINNSRSQVEPIVSQPSSYSVKVYSLYSAKPLHEVNNITHFNIYNTSLLPGIYILVKTDSEGNRTVEKIIKK